MTRFETVERTSQLSFLYENAYQEAQRLHAVAPGRCTMEHVLQIKHLRDDALNWRLADQHEAGQ